MVPFERLLLENKSYKVDTSFYCNTKEDAFGKQKISDDFVGQLSVC